MIFCIPRPKTQSSERSFGCSDVLHVFERPTATSVMCCILRHCPSPPPPPLPCLCAALPVEWGRSDPHARLCGTGELWSPAQHPCADTVPKGRALARAAFPKARPFCFCAFGFKRISCRCFQAGQLEMLPFLA